jgi:hypothetical protein
MRSDLSPDTAADGDPGRGWLAELGVWFQSIVLGVVYGVILRGLFTATPLREDGLAVTVISFGFLFVFPMVIGVFTGYREARASRTSLVRALLLPWLPTLTILVGSLIVGWEGLICIVMAMPIFLVMASVGGFAGRALGRALAGKTSRKKDGLALGILALPMLFGSVEGVVPAPVESRVVATSIDIAAPPEIVWRNIERVPAIAPEERRTTWINHIGFPPPLEATLSSEGVGGVRHATFERGILFVETVHTWEPEKRLEFSIRAATEQIPPTTLDEHLTLGGEYFDVLDGRYAIEPLDAGHVRLHLESTHRLSTHVNAYAGLWTDLIMRDIQDTILLVVKKRSEAQAVSR